MANKIVKAPGAGAKKRNWWAVMYPESLPKDWREQLELTGLKIAISPLHDKDIEPGGDTKKPHYHVILCYDGPQTYKAVFGLVNGKLGQPRPEAVESVRGAFRYLTHRDNPDKYQYSEAEITYLNGFCLRDFVELTRSETIKILGDIQDFVRAEGILEYSDLLDLLREAGDGLPDWYDVAVTHTFVLTAYLRSRRESYLGRQRSARAQQARAGKERDNESAQ